MNGGNCENRKQMLQRIAELEKEKERRIHWQGLAYAGMTVVDRILDHEMRHGVTEDEFKAGCVKAITVLAEQDREIAVLRTWHDKGMEVANGFLDKPSESHIVDRICIIGWERDELRARIKELEELMGEENFAERAAVRHYRRIKELKDGLRECCRMFEWCDTRYGQLLAEKPGGKSCKNNMTTG